MPPTASACAPIVPPFRLRCPETSWEALEPKRGHLLGGEGGIRELLERCEMNFWRPEPESNRRARICSPLRNHSAIGPGRAHAFAATVASGSTPCCAAARAPLVFRSRAVGSG